MDTSDFEMDSLLIDCVRNIMSQILAAVNRTTRGRNTSNYEDLDKITSNVDENYESHLGEEIEMTSVSVVPDGMRKIEYVGSVPTFTQRESGKPFRKNFPQYTRLGSNHKLPKFGILVYYENSILDHAVTEVGFNYLTDKLYTRPTASRLKWLPFLGELEAFNMGVATCSPNDCLYWLLATCLKRLRAETIVGGQETAGSQQTTSSLKSQKS
uniref:Uncharacterized protein n=1 Tax=Timema poppense TaxID=170557 RepID=A0A7R9DM23_TIMPO|nr:unnamed protein product [Timema poppensis]